MIRKMSWKFGKFNLGLININILYLLINLHILSVQEETSGYLILWEATFSIKYFSYLFNISSLVSWWCPSPPPPPHPPWPCSRKTRENQVWLKHLFLGDNLILGVNLLHLLLILLGCVVGKLGKIKFDWNLDWSKNHHERVVGLPEKCPEK